MVVHKYCTYLAYYQTSRYLLIPHDNLGNEIVYKMYIPLFLNYIITKSPIRMGRDHIKYVDKSKQHK